MTDETHRSAEHIPALATARMSPNLGAPQKGRALVAGIDPEGEELICRALRCAQIEPVVTQNVFDAFFGDDETTYEVLILGGDLKDIHELRGLGIQLPILAVLPNAAVETRVEALDMGADDCLGPPFATAELVARSRALCRRRGAAAEEWKLTSGDLSLCLETRTAKRNGHSVRLTPTEAEILRLFIQNQGRVLSPERIARTLWSDPADVSSNLISVHIRNLRRKVASGLRSQSIQTLRGSGYVMAEQDAAATSD